MIKVNNYQKAGPEYIHKKHEMAEKMKEPLSKSIKRFGRELKKPIPESNAKAIGKSFKRHIKKEGYSF